MESGYVLVDKPKDWTSHDVVAKIRNKLKIKKVGHTGTLDPIATGLLILLFGKATKMSELFMNFDKEYVVKCKLGVKTSTADITGEIINELPVENISIQDFNNIIPDILNIETQTPSSFSAIKINGKRAYKLARQGKEVDLPEREIKIKEFEIIDFESPYFTFRAKVSKGTYVRTLAEQIADLLGTIATAVDIRRTKIGDFHVENACTIDQISVDSIQNCDLQAISIQSKVETTSQFHLDSHKNPIALTIGAFDGVHLGHQHLLKETVSISKKLELEPVVITYSNHPNEILKTKDTKFLLTDCEKKDELIKKTGIEKIHYIDFDKKLSLMSADDFIKDVLMNLFNPAYIVVGYDTHFGVNKSGNIDFIKAKAESYGYKVIEIKPFPDANAISSTMIRKLILEGKVDKAANLLGYNYSIKGNVVSNKKIGRTIGFPTINLQPNEKNIIIPQSGVYHTNVKVQDKLYNSVTNIGVAPTVKKENITEIETFLIDFSDDLYNKDVEIIFFERLRDEMCFNNMDELKKQIEIDVMKVKEEK